MELMSAASFGIPSLTITSSSESEKGSGRKSTALTTEKMDVLAPTPSAKQSSAAMVSGRLRRSWRAPKRMSPMMECVTSDMGGLQSYGSATYVAAVCTFDGRNGRKVQRRGDPRPYPADVGERVRHRLTAPSAARDRISGGPLLVSFSAPPTLTRFPP